MNKQELIEYCESLKGDLNKFINAIDVNKIIKKIEQLDEPQKVTAPQIVAEYIKYAKEHDWDLQDAMDSDFIASEENRNLSDWFYKDKNMEIFALAWINGYEVEKEKRYLVKLNGINSESEYLYYGMRSRTWRFREKNESGYFRKGHTRKELEEAGFGDVFNSSLFEVEEVEE